MIKNYHGVGERTESEERGNTRSSLYTVTAKKDHYWRKREGRRKKEI